MGADRGERCPPPPRNFKDPERAAVPHGLALHPGDVDLAVSDLSGPDSARQGGRAGRRLRRPGRLERLRNQGGRRLHQSHHVLGPRLDRLEHGSGRPLEPAYLRLELHPFRRVRFRLRPGEGRRQGQGPREGSGQGEGEGEGQGRSGQGRGDRPGPGRVRRPRPRPRPRATRASRPSRAPAVPPPPPSRPRRSPTPRSPSLDPIRSDPTDPRGETPCC